MSIYYECILKDRHRTATSTRVDPLSVRHLHILRILTVLPILVDSTRRYGPLISRYSKQQPDPPEPFDREQADIEGISDTPRRLNCVRIAGCMSPYYPQSTSNTHSVHTHIPKKFKCIRMSIPDGGGIKQNGIDLHFKCSEPIIYIR